MFKKLITAIITITVMLTAFLPVLCLSTLAENAAPTITLFLGEPERKTVDGKNYVCVSVNVSDNTADLFTLSYRVMSQDKLTPVIFRNGTFEETRKNELGFENTVSLGISDSVNPMGITQKGYTGFQVVQDSTNGTQGISTRSGTIGVAWFEESSPSQKYTFCIESLGFNSVYTDNSGAKKIGVYTVNIPDEDKPERVDGNSSTSSLIPEGPTGLQGSSANTSENSPSANPQIGENASSQQSELQGNNTADSDGYGKYIFAVIGAIIITAIIIVVAVIYKSRSKRN